LVEGHVDASEGRDVDDGVPAHVLPDVGEDIERAEVALGLHEGQGLQVEGLQQDVDDAVALVAEELEHADHDDDGEEVRNVGDVLQRLTEADVVDLVEDEGQQDRRGETDGQAAQVEGQRVPDGTPGV